MKSVQKSEVSELSKSLLEATKRDAAFSAWIHERTFATYTDDANKPDITMRTLLRELDHLQNQVEKLGNRAAAIRTALRLVYDRTVSPLQ